MFKNISVPSAGLPNQGLIQKSAMHKNFLRSVLPEICQYQLMVSGFWGCEVKYVLYVSLCVMSTSTTNSETFLEKLLGCKPKL